jgi:4-amino-4-deoxy-L-arabinose transferase-like glycosyltransferase
MKRRQSVPLTASRLSRRQKGTGRSPVLEPTFPPAQRSNTSGGAKSRFLSVSASVSRHPRLVIGILLVACLGPFANKAIHTDDALFVWAAEWIQKHPASFYGFRVNWWVSAIPMWVANCNPPLLSYFLAGVGCVFGWSEVVLHLACLAVAFAAAMGIYSLAKMWCERPLLATMVAIFTPAFLVSSTTLMCDVPMLAFWIWALVLWEHALAGERSRWQFVGAGVLAGLAVLTKYSAVTLLPLLPILSLARTRKAGWWLVGLAIPLVLLGGYELITARMYGRGLFSAAVHYARMHPERFAGGWKARGIIGLAFAGGSLLPLLFFAPFLWRWRTFLVGGLAIIGLLLGLFRVCGDLGLNENPNLMNHWSYLLQVVFLIAGGIQLLLFTALALWQRRDATSAKLVFWISGGLVFAIALNWTVNARSFLPIVPAVAILLARQLNSTRGALIPGGWSLVPMIPAAAISLSVGLADYRLANSERTAAREIAAQCKTSNHTMWYEGHGAFQYYMDKLNGQPIDVERSRLEPEDVVVIPWFNHGLVTLPSGTVGFLAGYRYSPYSWVNVFGTTANQTAGFYDAYWGAVPFAIGALPNQDYFVFKIYAWVQFRAEAANPQAVQGGDVPSFPAVNITSDGAASISEKPETRQALELARQFVSAGRTEEAIQQYRKAREVDPTDPIALANLAWALTTVKPPALRNAAEAVQLAEEAVKLTGSRQPEILGTLAAAYAATGQFTKAMQMAQIAQYLAFFTGQQELALKSGKMNDLFAAGKTADALIGP